jgi:hypothetical protein
MCFSPSFQNSSGCASHGAASNHTPASLAAAAAQKGASSAPCTMTDSCSASALMVDRLRITPVGQ